MAKIRADSLQIWAIRAPRKRAVAYCPHFSKLLTLRTVLYKRCATPIGFSMANDRGSGYDRIYLLLKRRSQRL